jgi:carboxymethylenebutenolidase
MLPNFVRCSSLAIFCVALLPAAFASAQQPDPVKQRLETSRRHHEWVTVESAGSRKVRCFIVYPEVKDRAASVLIIHEIFGLSVWIRMVADAVAEKGYVAIVPDLLSGTGPGGGDTDSYKSVDDVKKAVFGLDDKQVMVDLDATAAYVTKLDASNGKLATMGFCWGGGKSFAYAAHNPKLNAALVFYGTAPDDAAMEKIKAPVYGFYGGNDRRITGQVPRVTAKMKELGKKYEPVVYEGAGHGFMRTAVYPDAPEGDVKAYKEARERIKKILAGL